MLSNKTVRHGDVDLIAISKEEADQILANSQTVKTIGGTDQWVAALGETTGHRHVITAEKPKSMEIFELSDGRAIIKMGSSGTITHEEHHARPILPGFFLKDIEREFDPWEQQIRQSQD